MRAWNRAKLLWAYVTRQSKINGLPVEYIVETTAKCNIYCPMCPREVYPQPKADMDDDVFERLVRESGETAEHMMLIGLGEPLLDPKIYERIEFCHRHSVSTLLSTNGTLLDEKAAARLLDTPLEQITFSFDGARKESFEIYRKGAKFERVRENFVRFARMKKERGSKLQIVVQMIRMEKNAGEVAEFLEFWSNTPGVDQLRIKEDETNMLRPDAGHEGSEWKHPCHYLWRGPLYVKQNGDVFPCCQAYIMAGDRAAVGNLRETSLAEIWNSAEVRRMRRLHVDGRAGEIEICAKCCTTIPHPALVIGSLVLHGKTVRRLLPVVERLTYFSKLPRRLLTPPKAGARKDELVKIEKAK